MIGFISRTVVRIVSSILLGGTLISGGYYLFGPEDENLGFLRRQLADTVAAQIADDVPEVEGEKTLAVLKLGSDVSGLITRRITDHVAVSGKYELLEEGFFGRLMKELGSPESPVRSLEEAIATANGLGVDYVLFGRLVEFSADPQAEEAVLKVEVRMAERSSGNAVFVRSYVESVGGTAISISVWRSRLADSSKLWRMIVWLVFALASPLATYAVIQRVTAEESNLYNLLLLSGYTVLDALFAFFLTGFWIATGWTILALLGALAGGGIYNLWIMGEVYERSR